jgi:NADPH-dependent 2,4-dienoyl-CoA reductase/sulfur reductase-like enzyme
VAARRAVVVGASLAGVRAVQAMRSKGFDGAISLIGDEPHLPYDRPPLSKQYLTGEWDEGRIGIASAELVEGLDLDLRLGCRAVGVDLASRRVSTDDGATVGFDDLVVATGSSPRRLADQPALDGIHLLRKLDDARSIRDALGSSPRVVVVGAGFIGAEVAASARAGGLEVTVLEALAVPLSRGLGPELGPAVAALHADHGVRLRVNAAVAGFEGTTRVERVRLADGTAIDADLVIVGVGTVPSTGWLDGSGIVTRDGVVCDEACRALGGDGTPVGGVWAAGDVARWPNRLFGEEMRVEHWDNAANQGAAVGAAVATGEAVPFAPVPFVWSEQYGSMIQILGRPHPDDGMEVVIGSLEERAFVALFERDGLLGAVVGMNESRRTMRFKAILRGRPPIAEARAAAAALR